MEFEKLFKVVVIGGSMLAGGCAAKTTTPATDTTNAATAPAETAPPADATPPANAEGAKEEAVDCDKICDGGKGRERFCPDPSQNDIENCCWLMSAPHECCEE